MLNRSSSASLEVAWRSTASARSAAPMPLPSSVTRISDSPPAAVTTSMSRRAGVERVLDQLLDHAGRPLDHLAGGDAVDGLGLSWRIAMATSPDGPRLRLGQRCHALARDVSWPAPRPAGRTDRRPAGARRESFPASCASSARPARARQGGRGRRCAPAARPWPAPRARPRACAATRSPAVRPAR